MRVVCGGGGGGGETGDEGGGGGRRGTRRVNCVLLHLCSLVTFF